MHFRERFQDFQNDTVSVLNGFKQRRVKVECGSVKNDASVIWVVTLRGLVGRGVA